MSEPYFDDGKCVIYHGDCREVLPSRDWLDVDVTIADPPYNETSLKWDRWPIGWPNVIATHTLPSSPLWCFGSLRMFMDRSPEFGVWSLAQDVIWQKHNGSSFHADRFRRIHESVAMFYRGKWADVLEVARLHERRHGTGRQAPSETAAHG